MVEQISEKMKVHEEWYKEAGEKDMSLEKLPAFLKKISEDYKHDYGTVCHMLAAGAVATCWALNRTDQGGITGFQAGGVMWEFIQNWITSYKGKPLKLVNFTNMLYPQYSEEFGLSISPDTWEWLQKEAKKNLKGKGVDPGVRAHWESIVAGTVPFGFSVKEE